jgi:hypothetical protein
MTPTEFDFTVTMPGDRRLVRAIRQLTAHAAGYAQLPAPAGERLAGHVERATEVAIASAMITRALIEYRFTAVPGSIVVVFSCDAPGASAPPGSVASDGLTVDWSIDGSRHVCRISQTLATGGS